MSVEVDVELLVGHWEHSHEEDRDGWMVFRRDDFSFPPSRGRVAMILGPDGVLGTRQPGPDDRPKPSAGSWRLEGNLLFIEAPGWTQTFEVESVTKDALVVRRVGKEF